jgi:hypothetical protein
MLEQLQARQILNNMDMTGVPPQVVSAARAQATMGDAKGAVATLLKARELHYSGGAAFLPNAQGGADVVARANSTRQLDPSEYAKYGIDPKALPPGTVPQIDTAGKITAVKLGDQLSQGRYQQDLNLAQQRADIQTKAIQERSGLSGDDAALLNRAIQEHRVDPNKAATRAGARTFAQLLRDDPNADFVTPGGIARMKQNPQIQMKIQTAATIPQMLTNLRDVVDKLDYSDVKAAGGFQKWWKGQTNDPVLAKYGPVRSDLVLRITNAMRGVGMSDAATDLENRVNSETMSPKAIAGYIEGQMESIMPQLQMYSGIALRTPGMARTGLPVMEGTQFPNAPPARTPPPPAGGAPAHPANIPPGSMYSPSRKQYKTPDGRILDQNGKPL